MKKIGSKRKGEDKNEGTNLAHAGQPKFVVRSGTAFPSTFIPSTLFPQKSAPETICRPTCIYLVAPVVCIRI